MQKTNSERLKEIAEGMKDLNERLVYVGGAMVGLYTTDPAAPEPRTTTDVDCVVNSSSYAEHSAFEEMLRARHFKNDPASDAPICRWQYNGESLDVMSMEEKTLAFGNRWYRLGFEKRERFMLPSGIAIYRLPVTYYVATKIEALLSRGGKDWRGAKDFEDIIFILNYCSDFLDVFKASDSTIKSYLAEQFGRMLQRASIIEEIECAMSVDEIDRTDMLINIMREIAIN